MKNNEQFVTATRDAFLMNLFLNKFFIRIFLPQTYEGYGIVIGIQSEIQQRHKQIQYPFNVLYHQTKVKERDKAVAIIKELLEESVSFNYSPTSNFPNNDNVTVLTTKDIAKIIEILKNEDSY